MQIPMINLSLQQYNIIIYNNINSINYHQIGYLLSLSSNFSIYIYINLIRFSSICRHPLKLVLLRSYRRSRWKSKIDRIERRDTGNKRVKRQILGNTWSIHRRIPLSGEWVGRKWLETVHRSRPILVNGPLELNFAWQCLLIALSCFCFGMNRGHTRHRFIVILSEGFASAVCIRRAEILVDDTGSNVTMYYLVLYVS